MRILSRVLLTFILILAPFCLQAVEKIDVNTASLEDLVKIIHIGEARALELISLRPFSSLDDLTRIKGIGDLRVEDIKKQGLATEEQIEIKEKVENNLDKKETKLITSYPTGIVINEILPSPKGPDAENEWIELFNQNNFKINLSGWQITDLTGVTKTYSLVEETNIGPEEFLVLSRPKTKITLNNNGDGIKLIQPNGKIVDEVNYEKVTRGESFNRSKSGWQWSSTLTPGKANIIPSSIDENKETIEKSSSKEEIENKKKLAAIGEQIPEKPSDSLTFFLIALGIAIFSGIIILNLKKKIKSKS